MVFRSLLWDCIMTAECFEGPDVALLVVPEHINVAVVGTNAEIGCGGAVPPVFDAFHGIKTVPEHEPDRALISAVPRIAFDVDYVHESE